MSKRPTAAADSIPSARLTVRRNAKNEIFSPLRGMWLVDLPEERVRQDYV
jgi:hypothetical protein